MPTQHQVTGRLGQGIPTRSLTDRAPTLLITADAQKVPIYLDDTYTLKLTPQVFSIGELGDYKVGNAEDDRTWDPPSYSVSSPLEEDTVVNFVELAPITINATDGATPVPDILTVPMYDITIDYYDSPDTGVTGEDPDLLVRNFKKETSFSITAPDTLIGATPPNAGGFIKWVNESGATITTDNTLSQVAHAKATITAIYEIIAPTIPALEDLIIDLQCDYGLTGSPITGGTSKTTEGQSYACSANHHSVSSSTLNGINVLDTTTGIYSAQLDHGTIPESFIEDDVTVAILFKPITALTSGQISTLFKASGWDTWLTPHLGTYFGLYLYNDGTGPKIYLQYAKGYSGSLQFESHIVSTPAITNNVWNMLIVTFTRSTKTYSFYTEYDDGATAVGSQVFSYVPSNDRTIGSYYIGEAGTTGNHAMTLVWKKVLTEAEREEVIAYMKNKYGAV